MLIRDLEERDLAALHPMVVALSAHHADVAQATPDTLARDALGPTPWVKVIVAEDAGNLVGYAGLIRLCRFQDSARLMDLHHLFVQVGQRGRGIGWALLDASCDEARKAGCVTLFVGTAPDNTYAQKIYETYGFARFDSPNTRFRLALA
jgi:ribosomal protein S18 acetylase RimI-like enzyme